MFKEPEACLLCFEVLPLSLLTCHAWKPRLDTGDWYDADGGWGDNVTVGRLAGEGPTTVQACANKHVCKQYVI